MRAGKIESLTAFLGASLFLLGVILTGTGCEEADEQESDLEVSGHVASSDRSPSAGTVKIHQPMGSMMIATGLVDEHGRPVMANCATCHATRPANPEARIGSTLVMFHQGLKGPHGNLSCLSCHHPEDGYRSLRLADGKKLPPSDVMTLCAQCHGPQYRDYQRGAHGGMVGYWDLSKGGRERNNCVDCHQPHAPAFPLVQPAPGPRDRFLKGADHE